jgi:hypothetical protein
MIRETTPPTQICLRYKRLMEAQQQRFVDLCVPTCPDFRTASRLQGPEPVASFHSWPVTIALRRRHHVDQLRMMRRELDRMPFGAFRDDAARATLSSLLLNLADVRSSSGQMRLPQALGEPVLSSNLRLDGHNHVGAAVLAWALVTKSLITNH